MANQRTDDDAVQYRFIPSDRNDPGSVDLSSDRAIALLACCVASQQSAGFGDVIDLRKVLCRSCDAPGFNSGWGAWFFVCGSEVLSDGEVAVPCPQDTAPYPSGEGR